MRHVGRRGLVILAIAGAGVWAAWYLGLGPAELWPNKNRLGNFVEFFSAAFSPAVESQGGSGQNIALQALRGTWLTVLFALAGMSLALVVGVVLGFFASSAWWTGDPASRSWRRLRRVIGPLIFGTARLVIALLRSVHEIIWATLFLAAFGLSNANAVFALALPYGGTLAKIFSEMIDEAPRSAGHALRGAGAGGAQVFFLGLLPGALPDMASYAFYRFECALRASAVLGFFGVETLGHFIKQSFKVHYYGEVWTYLYALFALVIVADLWSGALRHRTVAA